jgi:DNA polymerase
VRNAKDYVWFAFNAFFEYAIWVNVLKFPPLPIENIQCTRSLALALALPPTLAECGEVLGLPDHLIKNPRGKELIDLLSKPQKDGSRNRDTNLLDEFYEYNLQDTIAEHAVKKLCRPLIPSEREVWEVDFKMNLRGIPIDVDLLTCAAQVYRDTKGPLKQKLKDLTGLDNPNSGKQFMEWLAGKGFELPNLQKPTVEALIADLEDAGDTELVKILRWRSALARTPLTKYEKTLPKLGNDGRYHGGMTYHKATPGRWSSTGVNFQNLNRPTLTETEIETAIGAIKTGSAEFVGILYDDPIEAMSSCLRGMVCASPGHKLCVADYSSIESRVLAWLAGQRDKIRVFETHGKVYEHAACQIFGMRDIDKVSALQRSAGKVLELACGYQGAYRAVLGMAVSNRIDLQATAQALAGIDAIPFAKKIVAKWRQANDKIEKLWYDTDKAAIRAVLEPGTVQRVNKHLAFKKIPGMLLMQLPSGRQIAFFNPKITDGSHGPQVTYWCINSKTHKWSKKHGYGGDFVQSATQGTARDIMASALLRIDKAGFPIVLLIHDEIATEVPEEWTDALTRLIALMCEGESWAKGLPINASGYLGKLYKK